VPKRLLPLAVAALVLVVGSACAKEVSPAARVGGHKLSDSQLSDEVSEWAHNKLAFDQDQRKALNPGTYPMSLVSVILQQRIEFMLANAEFAKLHLKLTDDDRSGALALLAQQLQGDVSVVQQALAGFGKSYGRQYLDDMARQYAVQAKLGQTGYAAWRATAYSASDIHVSPRYGSWDASSQQVVPPKGPSPAPGETTTTATS
jgi:hypothetical protein